MGIRLWLGKTVYGRKMRTALQASGTYLNDVLSAAGDGFVGQTGPSERKTLVKLAEAARRAAISLDRLKDERITEESFESPGIVEIELRALRESARELSDCCRRAAVSPEAAVLIAESHNAYYAFLLCFGRVADVASALGLDVIGTPTL